MLDIELADPLDVGVEDGDDGRVPYHAPHAGPHQFPFRQPATGRLRHVKQRDHLVVDQPRIGQGLERDETAEHVPAAEHRPRPAGAVDAVDPAAGIDIASVDIVNPARVKTGMVHRGRQHRMIGIVTAVDPEIAQFAVPRRDQLLSGPLKVPVRDLLLQVGPRPVDIDKRQPDLQQDRLVVRRGELGVEPELLAAGFCPAGLDIGLATGRGIGFALDK